MNFTCCYRCYPLTCDMGLSRSVGITKAWVLGLQLVLVPASGWDFLSHSVGLGETPQETRDFTTFTTFN